MVTYFKILNSNPGTSACRALGLKATHRNKGRDLLLDSSILESILGVPGSAYSGKLPSNP